jgi:hypothetical protein
VAILLAEDMKAGQPSHVLSVRQAIACTDGILLVLIYCVRAKE